ncbi:type II toxin-antitoxin system PemK/MazF family toxin [Ramlibacter tataouinensis]|uniref:type II toxin-antitoxin system PemK/MazF family toxin n=1 Tax=Ramlibacter tataouinensis TaxID=94132 RepID=UPI0034DFE69A
MTRTLALRPCVVVQNDFGNKVSPLTIVVAPLTDQAQYKKYPDSGSRDGRGTRCWSPRRARSLSAGTFARSTETSEP